LILPSCARPVSSLYINLFLKLKIKIFLNFKTNICHLEIIAFGDRQPEFDTINTQVIASSCDSIFTHLAWVNTPRSNGGLGDMKIPIVADFTKEVANAYGVVLPDGGDKGAPLRGLFIISPTGILRQVTVNDLPVGRNVDEIIRLVKAFQFVDVHGEVCPANWQPGDKTMQADPNGSKAYFTSTLLLYVWIPNTFYNPYSLTTTFSVGVFTGETSAASEGSLKEISEISVYEATVKAAPISVVDFWAPWCKNCKKVSIFFFKIIWTP
jgi:peroxiredoxin (alkyl hydroperoxide reductase subunit C)